MNIEDAYKVSYLSSEYDKYQQGLEQLEKNPITGDRNVGSLAWILHRYFDNEADKYHKYLYDAIKEMFTSKLSEITTELNKY